MLKIGTILNKEEVYAKVPKSVGQIVFIDNKNKTLGLVLKSSELKKTENISLLSIFELFFSNKPFNLMIGETELKDAVLKDIFIPDSREYSLFLIEFSEEFKETKPYDLSTTTIVTDLNKKYGFVENVNSPMFIRGELGELFLVMCVNHDEENEHYIHYFFLLKEDFTTEDFVSKIVATFERNSAVSETEMFLIDGDKEDEIKETVKELFQMPQGGKDE